MPALREDHEAGPGTGMRSLRRAVMQQLYPSDGAGLEKDDLQRMF
jgi:hypothetical protein